MKNVTRDMYITAAAQMNPSKIRITLFVLSLVMFVVAAGAPEAGGGVIR